MMDERILERMLDNLIEEAKPNIIKNISNDDLEDVPEVEFSKEHNRKMKKLFCKARRIENRARNIKIMKKVAVVAAVIILVTGTAISSVDAWRDNFINCYLNIKEKYSETTINYGKDNVFLIDDVYFKYIPDGFKYDRIKDTSRVRTITFNKENDETNYIKLETNKILWNKNINTESGDIIEKVINGKDMIYSENDKVKSLTWTENGYLHSVFTNDEKDILFKVAENIEFVNQ